VGPRTGVYHVEMRTVFFPLAGNRTPVVHPVPVAITTELAKLQLNRHTCINDDFKNINVRHSSVSCVSADNTKRRNQC
jgi:hypothetical protein